MSGDLATALGRLGGLLARLLREFLLNDGRRLLLELLLGHALGVSRSDLAREDLGVHLSPFSCWRRPSLRVRMC